MIFIERHIRILAVAVAVMIGVRITTVSEASSISFDGFDGGFLQFGTWLPRAQTSDGILADAISNFIYRARFGIPGPHDVDNLVTGSTGSEEKPAKPAQSENNDKSAEGTKKEEPSGHSKATDPNEEKQQTMPGLVPAPQGDAERSVLERLGLRRSELDKREEDLASREAMLKAAEQRLAERNDELKKLEADLKTRVDARNAELTSLKPIITIYETMKPKDAARVFEKLDFPILLSVAGAMNPRKLSDVLAQMDPVIAGKMTKAMTAKDRVAVLPGATTQSRNLSELPDFTPEGTP